MSAHNLLEELLTAPQQLERTYTGQAIRADRSPAYAPIITAAAETRTLPRPSHVGQRLTLAMEVDGGDCVITSSAAINPTGNTIITFDAAGEAVELLAVRIGADLFWRVVVNVGAALS